MDDIATVLARTERVGACLMWTGGTSAGYGQVRIGKERQYVHRLVYEALRGPIPPGLVIDHLCRNTLCINAWHLAPVTSAENTRRANPKRLVGKCGHLITQHGGSRYCARCNRERVSIYRQNLRLVG